MSNLARVLPNNIQAEIGLLGAIISNNDNILETEGIINSNDFYRDNHKHIYKAMVSLYKDKNGIDVITLSNKLKPIINEIGGISYLAELSSSGIDYNVKSYISIVKDCSNKRIIIKNAQLLLKNAFESDLTPKEIIDKFTNETDISEKEESQILTAKELAERTIEHIEERYNLGGKIVGMECGINTIDNFVDGFQKRNLYVIAGRPSQGKSFLSLQISKGLSSKYHGAIFSMEMYESDIGIRFLSSMCGINGVKMRRGLIEENEWGNLLMASSKFSEKKLSIDVTASQTIYDIKRKAKRLKMLYDTQYIIIDHVGLIEKHNSKLTDNQHIGEVTRQCKIMAKELDMCVILLSQLSRKPEERPDHRPIMSDLRDSGNIEQDADVVMFVYRDEYYDKETEEKDIMEILVGKNRNGRVGGMKVYSNLDKQIINDLARI